MTARRPNVNSLASHRAASIRHQVFTAVSAGFESYTGSKRQYRRVGSNQALGN